MPACSHDFHSRSEKVETASVDPILGRAIHHKSHQLGRDPYICRVFLRCPSSVAGGMFCSWPHWVKVSSSRSIEKGTSARRRRDTESRLHLFVKALAAQSSKPAKTANFLGKTGKGVTIGCIAAMLARKLQQVGSTFGANCPATLREVSGYNQKLCVVGLKVPLSASSSSCRPAKKQNQRLT